MKTSIHFVVQLGFTILAIFCIGSMPYLLFKMDGLLTVQKMIDNGDLLNGSFLAFDIDFYWSQYFHHIWDSFIQIFHFNKMTYYDREVQPLFPEFWIRYIYSMKILVSSLFIAFTLSVSITIAIMMLPGKIKTLIERFLDLIQSIPDIFYLIFFQILTIVIYVHTHIMLFQFMEWYNQIYGLPIIILTIVPTIQLVQYLLLDFNSELREPYFEFAKAKGMGSFRVLIVHVLRNALIAFLRHTNKIFLFSLSNLIMIEVLLSMHGFANFLFKYGPISPDIIPLGLLMLVLPFFLVFFFGRQAAQKWAHEGWGEER